MYVSIFWMLFISYPNEKSVPVANSSGIGHGGRHDEEGVGRYGILETVYVAQKVGQVEAHSQQLLRPTYKHRPAL